MTDLTKAVADATADEAWSPWPFTIAWAESNTIWIISFVVASILDVVYFVYLGGLIYFEYDKDNLML